MRGYSTDSQKGRIVSGEVDTVWFPRTLRKGAFGIVLLHGQGNPKAFMDPVQGASVRLAAGLSSMGFPCIAGEMHGNSWANSDGMADIPASRGVLQTYFPNISDERIYVIGASMGAALATRYAQLNPEDVAAAVCLIPAYDPRAIYIANNVGDAAMEAAWGFSGLGNFPDALDLGTKGDEASSVPLLTSYASNDSIVPAASVTAYHESAGGLPENLINVGALDHTDAAIGALPIATVTRFLLANGV